MGSPLNIAIIGPLAPLELSPGTYSQLVTDTLGDAGSEADGAPVKIAAAAELLTQLTKEQPAMNAEVDALGAVLGELDSVAGEAPDGALQAANDFVQQGTDGVAGTIEPGVSLPEVPTDWQWRGQITGGGGDRGVVLYSGGGSQVQLFGFTLGVNADLRLANLSVTGDWPNWDGVTVLSSIAYGGTNHTFVSLHSSVPFIAGTYVCTLHGTFTGGGERDTPFETEFTLQVS